jgi:MATE family multidrug resistance protein
VQPLVLALAAGAAIVLLRMPLIDLALHIVGGSEAVLEQARRFLEIRWLSAPASLANGSCWAGCWACSTPERR